MHRQLITRTQYLAELNRRLRDHPDYVDGMQFVSNGSGDPETAAGFDWEPQTGNPTPPNPLPVEGSRDTMPRPSTEMGVCAFMYTETGSGVSC